MGPLESKTEGCFRKLPDYLMLLSFSASIITLKVSIENSSYETMVNVFNLYIEYFSSNYLTITNLMTEIFKESEKNHLMILFE
jgi:hypothetical protein